MDNITKPNLIKWKLDYDVFPQPTFPPRGLDFDMASVKTEVQLC